MKDSHLTLRLSADLARALAQWARARGIPKSEAAREAVARYLAPPAVEQSVGRITARELAGRWPALPRLNAAEATAFADDIDRMRAELPRARAAWE